MAPDCTARAKLSISYKTFIHKQLAAMRAPGTRVVLIFLVMELWLFVSTMPWYSYPLYHVELWVFTIVTLITTIVITILGLFTCSSINWRLRFVAGVAAFNYLAYITVICTQLMRGSQVKSIEGKYNEVLGGIYLYDWQVLLVFCIIHLRPGILLSLYYVSLHYVHVMQWSLADKYDDVVMSMFQPREPFAEQAAEQPMVHQGYGPGAGAAQQGYAPEAVGPAVRTIASLELET